MKRSTLQDMSSKHLAAFSLLTMLSSLLAGCDSAKQSKQAVHPGKAPVVQTPSSGPQKIDQPFEITSFDRCVAAGLPIMESSPRQCSYKGQTFVEAIEVGNKGDRKDLMLRIAATDSECSGAHGPRRCLVANGELFYDPIEGFRFTPGIEQILEVRRTQVCDPNAADDCPQDVGIYKYELIRTVERLPAKESPAVTGPTVFRGTIASIEAGKDGSTVELRAADGSKLNVVLSIPNLGPDSDFDFGAIKVGAKIEVQGEIFMLGKERQMAAKKARVL